MQAQINAQSAIAATACVTALQAMQAITPTAFIAIATTLIVLSGVAALIATVKAAWAKEADFAFDWPTLLTQRPIPQWATWGEATMIAEAAPAEAEAPITESKPKAPRKPRAKKIVEAVVVAEIVEAPKTESKPKAPRKPKAPKKQAEIKDCGFSEISIEADVFMFLTGEIPSEDISENEMNHENQCELVF